MTMLVSLVGTLRRCQCQWLFVAVWQQCRPNVTWRLSHRYAASQQSNMSYIREHMNSLQQDHNQISINPRATSEERRWNMTHNPLPLNYVFNWDTHTHMHTHQYNAHVLVTSTANVAKYINFSLLHVTEFLRNNVTSAISHEMSLTYISAHQQTPIPPPRPAVLSHQQTPTPPPRPAVLSHSISELKIDQPILTRCCSYAVGRTTRWHPATSSRIFFPLHLFSPRSCHHLSTAEHRLSMLFFFSHENIFLLSCLQL